MNNEKTTTFKKVKNGYIVSLSYEKKTAKGYDYINNQYIAKTPKEAIKLMNDLIK